MADASYCQMGKIMRKASYPKTTTTIIPHNIGLNRKKAWILDPLPVAPQQELRQTYVTVDF